MCKAGHQSNLHRIDSDREYDRDVGGRGLRGQRRGTSSRGGNQVNLVRDQLLGHRLQQRPLIVGPFVVDFQIFALGEASILQTCFEGTQ